jgi:hypothetical protein
MFDEIASFILDFYKFLLTPVLFTDIISDGGLSDYINPFYIFFHFRNGTSSRALLFDLKRTG